MVKTKGKISIFKNKHNTLFLKEVFSKRTEMQFFFKMLIFKFIR